MANKITQLVNKDGDNLYPLSGGLLSDSVTTDMLQDESVTSDKIDWATMDNILYFDSGVQSISLTSGQAVLKAISDYITIPNGYDVVSVTPVVVGSDSTVNAWTKVMGQNGQLDDSVLAIGIRNTSGNNVTWSWKVKVVCMKSS